MSSLGFPLPGGGFVSPTRLGSQKGRDGAFAQAVPASWNDFLLLLADSYWSFRSQLRHLLQEAFSALSHPTGQAPPLGSPGPWGSSVTAPTTPDWTVC